MSGVITKYEINRLYALSSTERGASTDAYKVGIITRDLDCSATLEQIREAYGDKWDKYIGLNKTDSNNKRKVMAVIMARCDAFREKNK